MVSRSDRGTLVVSQAKSNWEFSPDLEEGREKDRRVLEDPVRDGTVVFDRSEIDERDIRGVDASVWFVKGLETMVDLEVSGRTT